MVIGKLKYWIEQAGTYLPTVLTLVSSGMTGAEPGSVVEGGGPVP